MTHAGTHKNEDRMKTSIASPEKNDRHMQGGQFDRRNLRHRQNAVNVGKMVDGNLTTPARANEAQENSHETFCIIHLVKHRKCRPASKEGPGGSAILASGLDRLLPIDL
jgi:hypothetical protein